MTQISFKQFLNNFFIILSNALFCMTIYCTIFEWNEKIHIKSLWQLIGVSFLCVFTLIIFYSKKELNKKQMKNRIVIHFFVVLFILLLSGFLFGWVSVKKPITIFIFAVLCSITYWSVMLVKNFMDEKLAKELNSKLKELQKK